MSSPVADPRVIEIVDTVKGAVIPIRAIPRASRSVIAGSRDGMLLVRLQSAPTDGAANAELIGLLSRSLRIPKRDLEITSGETARAKRVRVAGLSAAEVHKRLGLGSGVNNQHRTPDRT